MSPYINAIAPEHSNPYDNVSAAGGYAFDYDAYQTMRDERDAMLARGAARFRVTFWRNPGGTDYHNVVAWNADDAMADCLAHYPDAEVRDVYQQPAR